MVEGHGVRHTPSRQRRPVWQSLSTVQKSDGCHEGWQKASWAQYAPAAQPLGALRQSSRQRPATQWVPAAQSAVAAQSEAARQKPPRHAFPEGHWPSSVQAALQALLRQTLPAGQSRSNWQVSLTLRHASSRQRCAVSQSVPVRHAPAARGTHVVRKSHQNPPLQSASAAHRPEAVQVPSLQYAPAAQSPSVRQVRLPVTQTDASQISPVEQSASPLQPGAATQDPSASQTNPEGQSDVRTHPPPGR